MKKRIGLLYGGKSAEHEVSLITATAVTKAIDYKKYDVIPIYITLDGEWCRGPQLTKPAESVEELKFTKKESKPNYILEFILDENQNQAKFDVIFPLLHGTYGEDGTVQGLLELLNLPYVGNGVLSSACGMDKVIMKQLFSVAGLNQVPFVYFIRYEWDRNKEALLSKCENELAYPMFVKPANLGSSVGINKASNREELEKAINIAFKYDRKIIVEQGIEAREIEMAVLGNNEPKVSVPGEIKPTTEFYDYESKYKDNSTQLIIPAEISPEVEEKMKDMAIRAFKILDCAGLVRADFFVRGDEVLINEVNTMPGFTPFSMYPLLWQNSGLSYSELIDRLIELAIERHEEKQQLQFNRE
ncbi:D-alanine--D-alanine ligase [Ureibacillus sp. FSL K6-8385]|uniref:D-alanine--D-alanine ligase n=1 Tax=Ureibacillus terrenus TaxID=118246 RepID=A0A540V0Z4_9BACL|nr:D-alanine--D-alanine ligase [Ureibacillus terrenus]MED3662265.1 D-alanine--D-alanine ligase [Ureibacillus terrenus]TQE90419.1 D-alanine--D-alanine ligase [Ureibacillus terrenus]